MKTPQKKERSCKGIRNKKIGKISTELRSIIIKTNKNREKKSSTQILSELRYGVVKTR